MLFIFPPFFKCPTAHSQYNNTWVEISREALKNNVRVLRGVSASGTTLMAVVKANAYGHGLK
ncbi:MAG: alanine racemase [Candidatus Yanofskybacteria bacterium]|nr:alanine racemase [Candidatus Yanofskybacteria bacterium]